MSLLVTVIGIMGAILFLGNLDKVRALVTDEEEAPTPSGNGDTTLPPQDDIQDETEETIRKINGTGLTQAIQDDRFILNKTADTIFRDPSKEFALQEKSFEELRKEDFQSRQESRKRFESKISDADKFATSLEGASLVFGAQIKRDEGFEGASITDFQVTDPNSTFQVTLKREQDRAARLAQQLFGSIANPDFGV